MTTIIKEGNQSLQGKTYKIPTALRKHLQSTLTSFQKYSTTDGYKRINGLINPSYNKKEQSINHPKDEISYGNLKRIKHDYEAIPNKNNIEAKLMGGDELYQWVDGQLSHIRTAVEPVNKVKKSANISKSKLKVAKGTKGIKPEKLGNAQITIHESKKRKIYIT